MGININFFNSRNKSFSSTSHKVLIKMHLIVNDPTSSNRLWEIYNNSFIDVNKLSPCQQSIRSREIFIEDMNNPSIFKYLLYINGVIEGVGIITNELKNCTWISDDFFAYKYKELYSNKKIYYFMGIAVNSMYRKMGYSKKILSQIMIDMPDDSVIGFDHSYKTNRFIPYFTGMIRINGRRLKNICLDKQVYYLVNIKK